MGCVRGPLARGWSSAILFNPQHIEIIIMRFCKPTLIPILLLMGCRSISGFDSKSPTCVKLTDHFC